VVILVAGGFIALCSLVDAVMPIVLERFAATAQATGVTGAPLGTLTFLVFAVLPWSVAIAGAWLVQVRVDDRDRRWLLQLPFFALILTVPPHGDEASAVLPPSASATYRALDSWLLGIMLAGLAVWAAYRMIRWLVHDEKTARSTSP